MKIYINIQKYIKYKKKTTTYVSVNFYKKRHVRKIRKLTNFNFDRYFYSKV